MEHVRDVCKPGNLYNSVAEFRIVRAFIGQYQVRASATTVMGKAMHLRRLADEAVSYFTEVNEQEKKGRCMSVASYLRSVAASYKTESRRVYRSRNTVDDKAERGALLVPADFDRCLGRATSALEGVMRHAEQIHRNTTGDFLTVQQELFSHRGIIEKWSINLLASLVLSGGGQRPQVYAQLEVPQASELQHFEEECAGNIFYFTLRAGREKTTRSIDLPTVMFPRMMLKYIRFHVLTMRPIMLQQVQSFLSRGSEYNDLGGRQRVQLSRLPETHANTLLLHTKTGISLTSSNIKRSMSRFLSCVDPELAEITPMSIRGSYASMMLQSYRRKQIFKEMDEQEFLVFLSKQMNTSAEQLAATYASCDVNRFEETANEMMKMLDKGMQNHEDDIFDDGEVDYPTLEPLPACQLWN